MSSELHLVNRLTWGARPGDMARLRELGAAGYLEWQLDHEAIPDPLVERFLEEHPVLLEDAAGVQRALDVDYGAVVVQVLWGRVYRAVYSERQLFEKLVEFWTDHFNVPLPDLVGPKVVDDREVIRRHALGSFRDLLLASARSPAMLLYLDNFNSRRDHPNQNYARELLELHTVGVDGGYTQRDVEEVARCFTGWTLREGWRGDMVFDRAEHDEGEKVVMGHRIAAGRGIEDGLEVLDILAGHPATAEFVSRKLCRRFVADEPPDSVVAAVAATFRATGGDVRAVLRTLFGSPEFVSRKLCRRFVADEPPDSVVAAVAATFRATGGDVRAVLRTLFGSPEFRAARGTKFRRPLEAIVAMLRALTPGVSVNEPWLVGDALERMGQLPFNWFPPNGYPDRADQWFNAGGLLQRWNAALVLGHAAAGWTDGGITLDLDAVLPATATVGEAVDATWRRLVGDPIDAATRRTLLAGVGAPDPAAAADREFRRERLPALVGLVLASPAFQLT